VDDEWYLSTEKEKLAMPEDVNTQFEDLLIKVEMYLSHLTNRCKVLREQVNGYEDKYHPTCIIVKAKMHECDELRDEFMGVFENVDRKEESPCLK
jgi:hypothetical protein